MIYRSKTNPSRRNIIYVIIAILVVIGFFRLFLPHLWSSIVMNGSRPFLRIGSGLASLTGNVFNSISGRNGNQEQELRKRIGDLSFALSDRNLLADENKTLKEIMGRTDTRNFILATVISKPIITPYDTFIIDQGSNNGIRQDSLVLAGTSTVVGQVSEVYSSISKVTAYSSPGLRHTVYIGEKNLQAEAIGQGHGNFKVVLPEGSEVKVGDSIFIPNIIPTIFGTIEKIVPSNQLSFINVLFKSPVNLGELYYVQVVK